MTVIRQQLDCALAAPHADLILCALLLEKEERPGLVPHRTLQQVDAWATLVDKRLGGARAPVALAETIADLLFSELGFRPNRDGYYQAQNSHMSQVIDRRLGIPISLSLLYLGIGQRLGAPMTGIGFPGHFLLRIGDEQNGVLADPFGEGHVLDRKSAEELLRQYYGRQAELSPSHLQPLSTRATLARMQRNLKLIYLKENKVQAALDATDRIVFLQSDDADERRDRGLLYERLECFGAASRDYEFYLQWRADAEDAAQIHERLLDVSAKAAMAN